MVLGLNKGFAIALFAGIVFSIGMEDKMAFLWIVGGFIVIRIVWNFLTK